MEGDELPSLYTALAFPEMTNIAVIVGENLDFNMPETINSSSFDKNLTTRRLPTSSVETII
jgi:hypothetical protein